MAVLPPTTGGPLNLYVPPFDYGVGPNDFTYDVPVNDNWTILNTFASSVVLYNPTASQTIAQPSSTYLNINSLQAYGTTPVIRFGVAASAWDTALSRTAAGVLSVDANSVGASGGTLKATVVNALTGFQVNGAAPNGYILVGNGTDFVASATLPAGLGGYTTVEQAGTQLTQRSKLNFLAPLTAVDDSGNTSTDVGLAASGVTAGSYANPTITIDTYGRITAVTTGGAVVGTVTDYSTSGRVDHTVYQNTSGGVLFLSGAFSTTGSSVGLITVSIGSTSALGITPWQFSATATASGGAAPFMCYVPNNWYYRVDTSSAVTSTIQSWVEIVIS